MYLKKWSVALIVGWYSWQYVHCTYLFTQIILFSLIFQKRILLNNYLNDWYHLPTDYYWFILMEMNKKYTYYRIIMTLHTLNLNYI